MRKYFILAAALVILATGAILAPAQKTEPFKRERELFVPFDDLHVVLEGQTRRVLLTRKEYEDLLARARRTAETHAPVEAMLVSANYVARLTRERAEIDGTLEVNVLEDGLHVLPLDLGGVGMRTAVLDGKGAPIGLAADGRLTLFVEGKGRHELSLGMVAPLQTTAARQILSLRLPTPSVARLSLSIPGDVEVKSGAPVVSRVFDADTQETRIEVLPERAEMSLVMTLNSRLKQRDRVVVARSVQVDEFTQAYERLHATVSMDVLHASVERFRFAVPPGFDVTEVRSPQLARWAIGEEDGRTVLDVFLREEAAGLVVLNLSALRTSPDLTEWTFPRLVPLDVAGHVSVVGLLLEDRLKAQTVTAADLIPIDVSVLTQALPSTVLEAEPGAVRIRPVLAYYAPQADFSLTARFAKPPAKILATTNLLLVLEDSGHQLRGGFALLPEEEKLFALDFSVPAGWDVKAVTGANGDALRFERYGRIDEPSRIHVKLPQGVPAGQEEKVYFQAVHVPGRWFDPWTSFEVAFPEVAVIGAGKEIGALAVDARDDMVVRPQSLSDRLTPLDENEKAKYGLAGVATSLAYRYEGQPYQAKLSVERIPSRLTARTYSFFRVERDALVAHYELIYNVERARTRSVTLLLPASTPTDLSIRGLGDLTVKEYTSAPAGDARRWTVLLSENRSGTVALAVDFQQRFKPEELADLTLPVVRADAVAYQSGLVAVEGAAELDVEIPAHPRKVDVGELVDAEYQPGARLLGVYAFVGDSTECKVRVTQHPAAELPPAIVQRAELATVLSANRVSQTAARFLLRTKALFLEVRLPEGSTLWSATLDGKPIKPQSEAGSLLLSLPAAEQDTVRDVQVVYETPAAGLGFLGEVGLAAPKLFLHADQGAEGREVPVGELTWQVYLPAGYRLAGSGGTVAPDRFSESSQLGVVILADGILGAASYGRPMFASGSAQRMPSTRLRTVQAYPADESCQYQITTGTVAPTPPAQANEPALPPSLQPPSPQPPATKKPSAWALEGVRSLKIDLVSTEPAMGFSSLGVDPRLSLTVVNRRQFQALGLALALAVLVGGIALTNAKAHRKLAYILTVAVAATLIPLLAGVAGPAAILNGAFYAAMLLVPYYLLVGLVRSVVRRVRALLRPRSAATTILAALVVGLAAASSNPARAEDDGAYYIRVAESPVPVNVPADALIVPYDPKSGTGIRDADKLMIPYDRFVELWNLANPKQRIVAPPAPYALAGASFTTTLQGDDYVLVQGRVDLQVYTEGYAIVPLPLEGGVLAQVDLDGKPARLGIVTRPGIPPGIPRTATDSRAVPQQQAQTNAAAQAPPRSFVVLYASGKGAHRLNLAMRMKLERRGGWRVAEGRLPAAPATALDILVPQALTEVNLAGISDRQTYETQGPGETIRTSLGANGSFSVQWRPKVQEGEIDRTLTIESDALLDVREDRVGLVWNIRFLFRRGERDGFTLEIPADLLVEKVVGANVRGWEVRKADGKQTLEVALLKRAKESESFAVSLWRPWSNRAQEMAAFDFPLVGVSEAVRHSGQLAIRRSPLIDLRTTETGGVTRIDVPAVAREPIAVATESPLGIRPYEAYKFAAVPFTVRMSAKPVEERTSAVVQTLLRISERERTLESRALISVQDRPCYRVSIAVPADLKVEQVRVPGRFEWAVNQENGRQVLTVHLAAGIQGDFPVLIGGPLGSEKSITELALPEIEVLRVQDQQGDIVVQVDPAFDVAAQDLKNIENVLLSRVSDWLKPEQRKLARLAFHYKTALYAGRLTLTARKPDVSCYTVTNVRITDRTIEDTILLDFAIRNAGVRQVSFVLPGWMKDAAIRVPLLRQKTVQAVGTDPAGPVRVRLELQDEVMNQLRVLVENDRLPGPGVHEAPIPVVETGRTDRRYVALETAGRDEVVLDATDDLEPLSRQQKEWATVAGFFRGGMTRAFIAKTDAAGPRLAFHTTERAAVETAGARIGLAQTVLVLDASGAYRAQQTYTINNATEQFLEIELPRGASLWTALVAHEPVKPVRLDDPAKERFLRIPLVKTAPGELDYAVELKYGGKMPALGRMTRVDFPIIRTGNVELSQVRLFLPQEYSWFDFTGTVRRVTQKGEFEAGLLSYLNTATERLVRTSRFDNPFAKVRSASNLGQLKKSLEESAQRFGGEEYNENRDLQQELSNAQARLKEADKEISEVAQTDELEVTGNSAGIVNAYREQRNERARNQVKDLAGNWKEDLNGDAFLRPTDRKGQFSAEWLADNGLQQDGRRAAEIKGAKRVIDDLAKKSELRADQPLAPSLQLGDKLGKVQRPGGPGEESARKALDSERGDLDKAVTRYQARLEQQAEQKTRSNAGQAVTNGISPSTVYEGRDSGGRTGTAGPQPGPGAEVYYQDGHVRWSGAVAAPSGLASLDFELPVRGTEYRFTTPRGDVRIQARAAARRVTTGLETVAVLVVVVLVVLGIERAARQGGFGPTAQAVTSGLLILGGGIGLVLGVLPVVSLIALVVGIVWTVMRYIVRRRAARV